MQAVDEVGNPTILATLTVIAAILPMAFVGGLMGPYMRPIPGRRDGGDGVLARRRVHRDAVGGACGCCRSPAHHDHGGEDRLTRALPPGDGPPDRRAARARWRSSAASRVLLLAAVALVPLELVTVKMLPFDNKSEFQVIVDMPEGTPLEETARVAAGWPGRR